MDVINKLYTSVSSTLGNTVSQLSNVLPGNPLSREYDIGEQIASAGPGLLWKVYKGHRKSAKTEVAIFVLERKLFEKFARSDRDQLWDIMRKAVIQLTKIRHPRILTVQHPLEESRDTMAFATEPVMASLANILGNYTNIAQPIPTELLNYKLHEAEIKYGLFQLLEALNFLHNDMKLTHHSITLDSIVVNREGGWKIFGFDFCNLASNPSGEQLLWQFQDLTSSFTVLTLPPLEYMAPETILSSKSFNSSDLYSLGILACSVYSKNRKPPKIFGNDLAAFRRAADLLKGGQMPDLNYMPAGLSDSARLMLHFDPDIRPGIHDILKNRYFDDIVVKTLSYLDSIFQWDNLQKSKFYKGMPDILDKLPHRLNVYRVVPCMVKEFNNPQMIPFVLPSVLHIIQKCTKDEYVQQILPHLIPCMKLESPIQILAQLLQKTDLLLKITPNEQIKSDVLPMLYRAMDSQTEQIQKLPLSILPTCAELIEYQAMRKSVLPRIKKICLNPSTSTAIKVDCLICVGQMLEYFDKWLVLDEVLPFLAKISSRDPAVIMATVGILKLTLSSSKLGITKDIIATQVIPFLAPLCMENGLTVSQFNILIGLMNDLIGQIEVEQRTKLKQISVQTVENPLSLESSKKSTIDIFIPDPEPEPEPEPVWVKKQPIPVPVLVKLLSPTPKFDHQNNPTVPSQSQSQSQSSIPTNFDTKFNSNNLPKIPMNSMTSGFNSPPFSSVPAMNNNSTQRIGQFTFGQSANVPMNNYQKFPMANGPTVSTNLLSPINGSGSVVSTTTNPSKQNLLTAQDIMDFLNN